MLNGARTHAYVLAVALVSGLMVAPIQAAILYPLASSVTVRFHSGDPDTPQGVAGLYRRIREAARAVCGQPDNAILLDKLVWDRCVDQAVAAAVSNVHSESLSAYQGNQIRARKRLLLAGPKVAGGG